MLVFVSYNRLDRDFALRLYDQLQTWGHQVWIDVRNIPKGAPWPDEIDKALAAADVVVGVLSENSMASGNVKNEWDWAIEYKKPLLLVRLRPCTISHRYIRINYIDCASDEAAGFSQFREALKDPKTPFRETPLPDAVAPAPPKPEYELRGIDNRSRMLRKVYDFWIKGVLEPGKIGWLNLSAEQRPEAVQPESRRDLHNPDFDSFSLGAGTEIAEVFYRMGRELLILGEPGSGKTMTLLELARDLIARAQADVSLPVPVVLNLASWAERSAPFAEWLAERLNLEYQMPRKLARHWVENGRLLLLLDGLDEVEPEHRDACVTAINHFWKTYEHAENGIVVCSRVRDYDALVERLHLDSAIVLKALTLEQAGQYLEQLGEKWANLRAVFSQSPILQALTESPLMLNIMAVAYQNEPAEQITGFLNAEDQTNHLFKCYVNRCLDEQSSPAQFPHPKTRRYLAWLAGKLHDHNRVVFHIEHLQPTWLTSTRQHKRYQRGLMLGFGLVFGLTFGLIGGLVGGLAFGLFVGLAGGVVVGLLGGLLVGLLSGLLSDEESIRPIEKLSWSWQKTLRGLVGGLLVGFISGLISDTVAAGPEVGLFGSLGFGLFVGLISGLAVGLSGGQIEMRTIPNQGIRRSWQSAVITLLLFGLVGGLIGGLFSINPVRGITHVHLLSWSWQGVIQGVIIGMILGMLLGLIVGLFGGLLGDEESESPVRYSFVDNGLLAVIQHTSLRLVLWRKNAIPLNYAGFLDYAASRHLLRKVGGGYLFRHRMLMEYFARLET